MNEEDKQSSSSYYTNKVEKKEHEHTKAEEEKEEMKIEEKKEEIKREKQEKTEKSHLETKESIDPKELLQKTLAFSQKNIMWGLLIIAIILSISVRLGPVDLPITDEWAQNVVYDEIRGAIAGQLREQFPTLPDSQLQASVERELNVYVEANQEQIDNKIAAYSNIFKSQMQDDSGQTYLTGIDDWLWYGYAKNHINNGHFGTTIKDGQPWNELRDGRLGQPAHFILSSFIMSLTYQIVSPFNSSFSPLSAAFYFPVIMFALLIIPVFFLSRRITNNTGAFIAAGLVAVHIAILSRSLAGNSDDDALTLVLPIFFAWLFYETLMNKTKWRWAYFAGAMITIGLLGTAWSGWWYILVLTGLASIAYVIGIIIQHGWSKERIYNMKHWKKTWKDIKDPVVMTFTLFVGSLVSLFLFGSWLRDAPLSLGRLFELFTSPVSGALWFSRIKEVGVRDVWPNVFTTVAELNPSALPQVIQSVGGSLFFVGALLGILLLLIHKKYNKYDYYLFGGSVAWLVLLVRLAFSGTIVNPLLFGVLISIPAGVVFLYSAWNKTLHTRAWFALLLQVWIVAMTFAGVTSVRFSTILAPAIFMGVGALLGIIYATANNSIGKNYRHWSVAPILAIILFILVLWVPFTEARAFSNNASTMMTDAWYDSLLEIKSESEDAIITSWWDFGHWFTSIAERRVTFDGGDQGRRIYWVGNLLLSPSQDESKGILQMLNCGQEEGYNTLESKTNLRVDETVALMHEIVVLSREDATSTLLGYVSKEDAEEILSLTHCEDIIPQYLIVSNDMVGKAPVWGHFGSWNFTKALWFNQIAGLNQVSTIQKLEELGVENAEEVHREIRQAESGDAYAAPWPRYYTGVETCIRSEELSTCGPLQINHTDNTGIFASQGGRQPIDSVFYEEGEEIKESVRTRQSGVSIFYKDNRAILGDTHLANSLFTKLYFFEGKDLEEDFTLLTTQRSFKGDIIYVYRVNFN